MHLSAKRQETDHARFTLDCCDWWVLIVENFFSVVCSVLHLNPYDKVEGVSIYGLMKPVLKIHLMEAGVYEVSGLGPGDHATIALAGGKWQILYRTGDDPGEWAGAYETADAALSALQDAYAGQDED